MFSLSVSYRHPKYNTSSTGRPVVFCMILEITLLNKNLISSCALIHFDQVFSELRTQKKGNHILSETVNDYLKTLILGSVTLVDLCL